MESTLENIVVIGGKFKKSMIKKGLTRAKAKCPFCEKGWLRGQLNPYRNGYHIWFNCDSCEVRMME